MAGCDDDVYPASDMIMLAEEHLGPLISSLKARKLIDISYLRYTRYLPKEAWTSWDLTKLDRSISYWEEYARLKLHKEMTDELAHLYGMDPRHYRYNGKNPCDFPISQLAADLWDLKWACTTLMGHGSDTFRRPYGALACHTISALK